MSASSKKAPTVDPVENQGAEQQIPAKTMKDLTPKLLTKILEFLMPEPNADNRNSVLRYRLVNRQWKGILNSLIEKKIISGEFPASPQMDLEASTQMDLHVRISPSRFRAGRNPFPFNSLHFNGAMNLRRLFLNRPERSDFPILRLPAFTSRFGENLTTLTLCDELQVPINTMAAMLSTMPNLKRLCLQEVMEENCLTMREGLAFPAAPALQNLTIMELALRVRFSSVDEKMNILYVWLIASYADQLVRLQLESEHPFPPLQARHAYTYSVTSGGTRSIATTSGLAFGNLKELKISHPSREFLVRSEIPALQRFSIVDTHSRANDFEPKDVAVFIDKCSSTLETLILYTEWKSDKLCEEAARNMLDGNRPLLLPASEAVFPKLKTVMIRYPLSDLHEMVLNEFVVKFPSLEKLHLLHFYFHNFNLVMVGGQDAYQSYEAAENVDQIVALKQQLALRFQELSRISNKTLLAKSNLARLGLQPKGGVEEQDAAAQRGQLETEIEGLEQAKKAVQEERRGIFKRTNALGKYTKNLMVEQLLEREGFWNTCPALKIVTVSYAERPDGSLLVARRPDDA